MPAGEEQAEEVQPGSCWSASDRDEVHPTVLIKTTTQPKQRADHNWKHHRWLQDSDTKHSISSAAEWLTWVCRGGWWDKANLFHRLNFPHHTALSWGLLCWLGHDATLIATRKHVTRRFYKYMHLCWSSHSCSLCNCRFGVRAGLFPTEQRTALHREGDVPCS